jgi:very-long-chain ceramide synthase
MYNSHYWLNLKELWTNFPYRLLKPRVKWYYLVQFAFWLQQLFVLNIEEHRKDHWQMFTHHIFTSALLITSYGFYQVQVGNAFLCIMDVVDILLPVRFTLWVRSITPKLTPIQFAKMLNYLNFRTACDVAFGVFLVVWFVTRHIIYNIVCQSILIDMPVYFPFGCYDSMTGARVSTDGGSAILANVLQPFNDPQGIVCFNKNIQYGFLGLLLALQVLTLIWFGMILRIAYGVLTGKSAEDTRSDDEASDLEIEEVDDLEWEIEKPASPSSITAVAPAEAQLLDLNPHDAALEHYFTEAARSSSRPGSPSVNGSASTSASRNKRTRGAARTSAISIPGHGDRKELLGRIGCDKPT